MTSPRFTHLPKRHFDMLSIRPTRAVHNRCLTQLWATYDLTCCNRSRPDCRACRNFAGRLIRQDCGLVRIRSGCGFALPAGRRNRIIADTECSREAASKRRRGVRCVGKSGVLQPFWFSSTLSAGFARRAGGIFPGAVVRRAYASSHASSIPRKLRQLARRARP